jgi:UDPglucose--hexose-1-phosphate uridylyltransferase
MAKFVPDIKTQRWIVISQTRVYRPDEHDTTDVPKVCVFCPGNEAATTNEVMRVGEGDKNQTGWKIRVIPNKYPITDIHEVIIHSPFHDKDIDALPIEHVVSLLGVYRSRYQAYAPSGQVMIFSNHGENAGASLTHPHSQVVVLPRQINLDALVREPFQNIVEDNTYYITYCPDFSQWPYEVWIAPKKEGTVFGEISDDEMKDLGVIFQNALKKLKKKHETDPLVHTNGPRPFAFNFYIHHGKNWFIRLIPRWVHRAGFELGTGLSVNVVDPTEAARELHTITIQ